jgi:hypothetical protein
MGVDWVLYRVCGVIGAWNDDPMMDTRIRCGSCNGNMYLEEDVQRTGHPDYTCLMCSQTRYWCRIKNGYISSYHAGKERGVKHGRQLSH